MILILFLPLSSPDGESDVDDNVVLVTFFVMRDTLMVT